MKNFKYILLTAIILTFFSCAEPKGGLFYSLEKESAIINGSLENNRTIHEMVRSNDYYFLAAGKFLYKIHDAAPEVEWSSTHPTDRETDLCIDFELVGNDIFAIFMNSGYGVYKASTANPAEGISWTGPLSFTNLSGKGNIIGLEKADANTIFVYTSTSTSSYNIYATSNATFPTTSSFETIATDIKAGGNFKVAVDGSDYWVIAGNRVFKTDGTALNTTDETDNLKTVSSGLLGQGFGGVACVDTDGSSNNEIYITSKEGIILKNIDGAGVWKEIQTGLEPLKDIIHVKIASSDINVLLAGSDVGYYEMEASNPATDATFISPETIDTNLTTANQYSSIMMSKQIIQSFYIDTEADNVKIFALGLNAGLWTNSLRTDGTPYYRFWDIE